MATELGFEDRELGFEGRFRVQSIRGLRFPAPDSQLTITGTPDGPLNGASPCFTIDLGDTRLSGVYRKEDGVVTGRYGDLGDFYLSVSSKTGRNRERRRLYCRVEPPRPLRLPEDGDPCGTWTADEDDP